MFLVTFPLCTLVKLCPKWNKFGVTFGWVDSRKNIGVDIVFFSHSLSLSLPLVTTKSNMPNILNNLNYAANLLYSKLVFLATLSCTLLLCLRNTQTGSQEQLKSSWTLSYSTTGILELINPSGNPLNGFCLPQTLQQTSFSRPYIFPIKRRTLDFFLRVTSSKGAEVLSYARNYILTDRAHLFHVYVMTNSTWKHD